MPIYTEIMSDSQILHLIPTQCHNIFLIGCGACTNESLAYRNDLPIYKECIGAPYPYATSIELSRIKKLLQKNGFFVECKYFDDISGFLCMNHLGQNDYSLEWNELPDIILCMCCSSGYAAIKKAIPTILVETVSQIKGVISYSYKDIGNTRIIVKEQSVVVPIKDGD